MPNIAIPQFSGEYSEWAPFKDMFTAFLKHDSKLKDVERLYYLKSSLSGEAAELIKNVPVTEENYNRAWTRLTTHYDNKRKLIHLCLESLFQLSNVSTESASALKALRNRTTEIRETLEALKQPVEKMDDLLVHVTVRRFDPRTRRDWELSLGDTSIPTTWAELDSFLKSRIEALGMTPGQKPALPTGNQPSARKAPSISIKPKPSAGLTMRNATTPRIRRCSYCQGEHYINACDIFRACSVDNRNKFVSEKQLCLNCLGVHRFADCRSRGTCASCHGRHHTLLHRESRTSEPSSAQLQGGHQFTQQKDQMVSEPSGPVTTMLVTAIPVGTHVASTPTASTSHSIQALSKPRAILLATALVRVSTERDRTAYTRVLVDPCSEASFIAESLAQRLRVPRQSAFVPVTGVGATSSHTAKSKTSVLISPHFKSNNHWKLTALILPRLTDYVLAPQSISNFSTLLNGVTLADPKIDSTDPIEMIIGADLYPQLIEQGLRKGTEEGIIAQATALGWILTGAVNTLVNDSRNVSSFACHIDLNLSTLLARFWQQEEVEPTKPTPLSKDERECEDHFIATHTRRTDGRYVLRLPFKSNLKDLGDSKQAALRALLKTEQRI